jgi:hypothetical protein
MKNNNKYIDDLITSATQNSLSKVLPSVLAFALKTKNTNLEKWVRLELGGYYSSNKALKDEDVVPEYRAIAGYYANQFGRRYLVNDPELQFINEDRLRNGVAELEKMSEANNPLNYSNPGTLEIIKRTFNVEVSQFVIQPSAIHGILSDIRAELISRLEGVNFDMRDDDWETNIKEPLEKSKLHPRKVILISFLVVFIGSVLVFIISYFVQPKLIENHNRILLIIVGSINGVIILIAGLNEVIEFCMKIFGQKE